MKWSCFLSNVTLTMFCKARITDKKLFFPGTVFYTSTECAVSSKHSVKHEDGESSMSICGKCLKRYIQRASGAWYGWFDDVYPVDAPVRGSNLYKEMVKLHGEPRNEPFDLTCLKEVLPLPVKEVLPPPIPSIDSLHTMDACKEARLLVKAWIKGEGAKNPRKLQPYYKADMEISAKMKRI